MHVLQMLWFPGWIIFHFSKLMVNRTTLSFCNILQKHTSVYLSFYAFLNLVCFSDEI